MAKKQNRKKILRKQAKRLEKFGTAKPVKTASKVATSEAASVKQPATKDLATKATAKSASEKSLPKSSKAGDFATFAASLEGVSEARLRTFFDEGITSIEDFANYTDKELTALKGIGPATLKQLQEKGVRFK